MLTAVNSWACSQGYYWPYSDYIDWTRQNDILNGISWGADQEVATAMCKCVVQLSLDKGQSVWDKRRCHMDLREERYPNKAWLLSNLWLACSICPDAGREDAAFKQSRVMGAGNMVRDPIAHSLLAKNNLKDLVLIRLCKAESSTGMCASINNADCGHWIYLAFAMWNTALWRSELDRIDALHLPSRISSEVWSCFAADDSTNSRPLLRRYSDLTLLPHQWQLTRAHSLSSVEC